MKQPVTGSFELIKNMNTACILNAIREEKSISRADIARRTGLTPATVSNIVWELIHLGLVVETDRGESNGGRKPVLLEIRTDACLCGGIHIGPEVLEVALTDVEANIVWLRRQPMYDGIPPREALGTAAKMLNEARREHSDQKLAGIGVCVHGLVRSEDGVSVYAPNLGWENVPIGEIISTESGLPVYVENNVRAMSLAESWCGAARTVSDYVYLYVGTGIGGSIVMDNEPYKGYGGFAGEFGHTTIEPSGPKCACGNHGCLQALVAEQTVVEEYNRHTGAALREYTQLVELARQNDPVAVEIIRKSSHYIGIAVGNIINTFSPSLIVVNGGIIALGSRVMRHIEDEVRMRALKSAGMRAHIVFSQLGDSAPVRGAAVGIIRRLFETPRKFL